MSVASEVLCVGLLVTVAIPLLLPAMRRLAMDVPNERSSHTVAVPRGGGVALVAAVAFSAAFWHWPTLVLPLGVLAVALVGLTDDIWGLPALARLGMTVGISVIVALLLLTSPHAARATPAPLAVLVVLGGLFLVGYTNAFNFMDGINGISGLHAVVTGAALAAMSWTYSSDTTSMAVALAAAGAAFLPWNLPTARVFMGDVGSYGLGFGLAACGLAAWAAGVPTPLVLAPFGIYVLDTVVAVLRGAGTGRKLTQAHRDHVYQRLVDAGRGHAAVSCVVVLFSLLLVGAAVLAQLDTLMGAAAAAAISCLYLALPRLTPHVVWPVP